MKSSRQAHHAYQRGDDDQGDQVRARGAGQDVASQRCPDAYRQATAKTVAARNALSSPAVGDITNTRLTAREVNR